MLIKPSKILKKYPISRSTLYRWQELGLIKCVRLPSGWRLYDEEEIEKIFKFEDRTKVVK